VKPPVAEVSRDRVLTDDEIRWFWKATERAGAPFGPLFKLLLLTGQRLSEVSDLTDGELRTVEKLWSIPKERVKNGAAQDVPLSEQALAVLASVKRVKSKKGYLFTTTGETPVSGFSRAKANLDKAMVAVAKEEAAERGFDPGIIEIPAWRLHDLRRTAASGMARLGVNLPVIEKVLNHTSGSFAGIVGVYQRHSFADEKRRALETWARFLDGLIRDEPAGNVVALIGRA
jgi:integrase